MALATSAPQTSNEKCARTGEGSVAPSEHCIFLEVFQVLKNLPIFILHSA